MCGVLRLPAGYQECPNTASEANGASQKTMEEVAMGLLGPLPSGEHLLVFVDYYSQWVEVDVFRTVDRS